MLRPKIGLDWDDVTAPFNSIAIRMANEKYNMDPPLSLEEITSWENTGRASVIKEFYASEELYKRQEVSEKNKRAIRKLMEIADVTLLQQRIRSLWESAQSRSLMPSRSFHRRISSSATQRIWCSLTSYWMMQSTMY